VFFLAVADNEDDVAIAERLRGFLKSEDSLGFVGNRDMVAIKTHFGEDKSGGHIRPEHIKMIGELVSDRGGQPFLTETSTLYKGDRSDAIKHIKLAERHGFGVGYTGLPLIPADGLLGDEEVKVDIKGKIYEKVNIAALLSKVQAMIMVSHFTGHMISGFGAALKNMGMGCASRRGKLEQHSTALPSIKVEKCTKCGSCIKWCPESVITMEDESAIIDSKACIGCGECLAVCRFDAVAYNWGATYEDIQKKIVEHALGVATLFEKKAIYINFLTRISKDCDCMSGYEKVCPDIGILISSDPVAVDAASLDLVEERSEKKLSEIAYNIPYRYQIDYAREIGFGIPDYELIKVE